MEMDSMLQALCEENLLVDSTHKGPVTQDFDAVFDVSLSELSSKQLSC